MMCCSNCEKKRNPSMQGYPGWLLVTRDGEVVAGLCDTCQRDVLVMKLVFRRDKPSEQFTFEQYLPVEMVK